MANLQKTADTFKALSEGNRLEIIRTIAANNEVAAYVLLKRLDISQPTLSHHMKVLVEAGLVNQTRNGRQILYSINSKAFKELAGFLNLIA